MPGVLQSIGSNSMPWNHCDSYFMLVQKSNISSHVEMVTIPHLIGVLCLRRVRPRRLCERKHG